MRKSAWWRVTALSVREDIGRLVVSAPDRHGIVAAVSTFLKECGANILMSDQHSTDPEGGVFFMRMEFRLDDLRRHAPNLEQAFNECVAGPFQMTARFSYPSIEKRMAILVSRADHCLLDLLWRFRRHELGHTTISAVISNHDTHEDDVRGFGVPYHHVRVDPAGKSASEESILEILDNEVDLVVLARYMQILSVGFLDRVGVPVINIHHSFLPAFAGARPYERALERGVKVIGATAHYVTGELDGGPIIEQDIARVSHRDDVDDLARVGRDIERLVLARAVKWHLEDRVIVHGNRTVVF